MIHSDPFGEQLWLGPNEKSDDGSLEQRAVSIHQLGINYL